MTSPDSSNVRVGICGFCLPQAELFRRFKLLEVQQTFYWPPRLKTVERWRQTAPPDCEFTVKAFQAITHTYNHRTYRKARFTSDELAQCGGFRATQVVRDAWSLSRTLAAALEARFVVFQCPPRFEASEGNVANFRSFFQWADRGKMRLAWEPRHATWTAELIADLCRELDLIHVVDPLEQASVYGTPRYYRLHGQFLGNFRYDYNRVYTDAELTDLTRRISTDPTYLLFNNKQMAADAVRFMQVAGAFSPRRTSDHAEVATTVN